MQPPFSYRLKGQQLWLSAHRCIFWEEEKALILSDLHFGKTGHFRKSGVAVPQSLYREDLQRLMTQIQHFQPRQLLVVGDLFHSRENKELTLFKKWREDFPDLAIRLIRGNHDILEDSWYQAAGIEVSQEQLQIGNFLFVHDKEDAEEETDAYVFSGHVHPGISIYGSGRQSLRFPCFYFGASHAILPAFSHFTGTMSINPARGENVFAILPPSPAPRHFPDKNTPAQRPVHRYGTILQVH